MSVMIFSNKFKNPIVNDSEKSDESEKKEIKLRSEMYNNDNELLDKRDEDTNDAVMWGFVIGFALFFVLLIVIIFLTI